ncbi:unnamed protein product, partial [Symbiodinium sp. CCMP2456]
MAVVSGLSLEALARCSSGSPITASAPTISWKSLLGWGKRQTSAPAIQLQAEHANASAHHPKAGFWLRARSASAASGRLHEVLHTTSAHQAVDL